MPACLSLATFDCFPLEGGPMMKDTLLSDDAQQHLWNTPELDYLTHVVFRMYENKRYVRSHVYSA